jgi:hypothetical protein
MDWFFDHLQIVIFVVVGIFYVLRTLGQKRETGGDREPVTPASPDHESAEAERTRRIQEEIRRRILARQRGETTPAPVPGRMSDTPSRRRAFPRGEETASARPTPPPVPTAKRASMLASADETVLQQQRDLQEKLASIRAASAKSARLVEQVSGRASAPMHLQRPDQGNSRARRLRRRLAGTSSIRDAILLREIIGPPLGMQSSAGGKPNLP